MRIGWATVDWSKTLHEETGMCSLGGAGWARCGLPARAMQELGHETFVGRPILLGKKTNQPRFAVADMKGFDAGIDVEDIHDDLDVVIFQRVMHRDLLEDIQRYGGKTGQFLVNDVDDHFFGLDRRNVAVAFTDPKKNPDSNTQIYLEVLKGCHLVTCSTPFLAKDLQERGCERTVVVRNGLDLDDWTPRKPSEGFRTIGWVGAVPWRSGDLETVKGPLRRLEQLGAQFHHSGHHKEFGATFAERTGLRSESVDTSPMAPTHHVPTLYAPIDIGIVPLNDIPFNHAKSFIKGLEYAASGIPFVAQATPEYLTLEKAGIGVTARKARNWEGALKALWTSLDARLEQWESNREALPSFSIQERVKEWEAILVG